MDVRFQVCFTPLAAVLFAFPSRYWFTIGHHVVFSLGEWSPRIRTGFHVSRPTWDTDRPGRGFRLGGSHPLWPHFPVGSAIPARATARSRNPKEQALWFGLLRVRSPLLAQSRLLSSPRGTEMFHFPRCRPWRTIFVHPPVPPDKGWRVPPFGNLRINALWRLPGACRSLMRPSSPHDAKASVVRPYTLSKKSRYLVTLQFSLTLSSSVFKDLRRAPQGDSPCPAQRVSNIPKRPRRRKGVREDFRKFFRGAGKPPENGPGTRAKLDGENRLRAADAPHGGTEPRKCG